MSIELNLSFSAPKKVSVHLIGEYPDQTTPFTFKSPLGKQELEEIRWYLEDYGVHYSADPDDGRATRVEENLRVWGEKLFAAVFKANDKASELYRTFRDEADAGRLLTVAGEHPAVLSLPWELLRPPGGMFLFQETPRISIRRRLSKVGEGRKPHKRRPKPVLRLLFIVSRPDDAGFINPRADPQAVLDALDQQGMGRVEVEFLRPATLLALQQRLRDDDLPAVDIIHFDGHGAFDRHGSLAGAAAKTEIPQAMQEMMREAENRGDSIALPEHKGYLLFEDAHGKTALVDARTLGELLFRQQVGLVVLSACQSAAMDADDAMGSVSAWLTHAGIPSVLAMTHSVLVTTTRALFGTFYHSLLKGKAVGGALDDARARLYFERVRGEMVRQGGEQISKLELSDWFLPALYQAGRDQALLAKDAPEIPAPAGRHNLPDIQESGFFGRSRELWAIERAFAVQGTRRYSLTGFGGQGKTYLATEAGRWLLRCGLFQNVCFVSYAGFQGHDPVAVAVSTLATVLDQSLLDVHAAQQALAATPTLLILDNLESLEPARLSELLDAAAGWSKAGRVLLTARLPDFNHPDYPVANSFKHQRLALAGLAENDALDWFGELMRLPPTAEFGLPARNTLLELFDKVNFHPLSIALLAQQLKQRRPAELGQRLEALLAAIPASRENRSLLASLELSLERLPAETRQWLPRLGVFQGGALEEIVTAMLVPDPLVPDPLVPKLQLGNGGTLVPLVPKLQLGNGGALVPLVPKLQLGNGGALVPLVPKLQLGNGGAPSSSLAGQEAGASKTGFPSRSLGTSEQAAEAADETIESTWPALRDALHRAGLIQPLRLADANKTWLRFHPTLAPALWQKLGAEGQARLAASHRRHYYRLSDQLYFQDDKDPHAARAVVRAELPNLLHAVYAALEAGEEQGTDFATKVNKFLNHFGLRREHQALAAAANRAGDAATVGSQAWYLARSNLGEQLFYGGQAGQAEVLLWGAGTAGRGGAALPPGIGGTGWFGTKPRGETGNRRGANRPGGCAERPGGLRRGRGGV